MKPPIPPPAMPTMAEKRAYRAAASGRLHMAEALVKIKHPALWGELVVLR